MSPFWRANRSGDEVTVGCFPRLKHTLSVSIESVTGASFKQRKLMIFMRAFSTRLKPLAPRQELRNGHKRIHKS